MKVAIGMFIAFFAAGLLMSQLGEGYEPKEPELIPAEWYSTKPPRRIRKELTFEGMTCGTCHSERVEGVRKDKGEFHETIKLRHADNKRNRHCFNCHLNGNMDYFNGEGGKKVAYKDVAQLCSKCHGPIYRDWKMGSHGRRSGYWDTKKGKREVLQCIACHDPHAPVFKSMKPAGAPRLLREQKEPAGHGEGHSDGH
jgi:formate-dependent nitrite reductase cytochrome c552 subunit